MQINGNEMYWFENPADPTGLWTNRVIENRFNKYHDQTVGDLDGEPEILFASQKSGIVAYYDIPDDPTQEPWPSKAFHLISEGMPDVEGLVIVDIDGNGKNEVFAGPNIFRNDAGGTWSRQAFAEDYRMTQVAVADLDGDG